MTTYRPSKAFETVDSMMRILKNDLHPTDRLNLLKVFEETAKYRSWEKEEQTQKFLSLS